MSGLGGLFSWRHPSVPGNPARGECKDRRDCICGISQCQSDRGGADAWSALVQTAIASGSIPFAFAPRDLRRWIGGAWLDQYFQDGGIYDNDPIGQTINKAHDIDWVRTADAPNTPMSIGVS